jgi:hypothetical protein
MGRRSIRAYCPRCRHQQPFVRSRFDWKLHGFMTVMTLGIWIFVAISSALKRVVWPWACEHCGWHEPDFRSPEERMKGVSKTRPRAGESGSWMRKKDGTLVPQGSEPPPSAPGAPQPQDPQG